MLKLRVLIACEESQVVTKAFRALGHEAYSCDIQECSGGKPEWHILGDAIKTAYNQQWDLMIAHPPCTYLANSGARWLFEKEGRWAKLDAGCEFFLKLFNAPIPRIAIENPMPHKWGTERIRHYTQKVQPWWFGDKQKKTTCLWLKGLPLLVPTEVYYPPANKLEAKAWESIWRMPPSKDQAKRRSKTFPGFARAMAEQWGSGIYRATLYPDSPQLDLFSDF